MIRVLRKTSTNQKATYCTTLLLRLFFTSNNNNNFTFNIIKHFSSLECFYILLLFGGKFGFTKLPVACAKSAAPA